MTPNEKTREIKNYLLNSNFDVSNDRLKKAINIFAFNAPHLEFKGMVDAIDYIHEHLDEFLCFYYGLNAGYYIMRRKFEKLKQLEQPKTPFIEWDDLEN